MFSSSLSLYCKVWFPAITSKSQWRLIIPNLYSIKTFEGNDVRCIWKKQTKEVVWFIHNITNKSKYLVTKIAATKNIAPRTSLHRIIVSQGIFVSPCWGVSRGRMLRIFRNLHATLINSNIQYIASCLVRGIVRGIIDNFHFGWPWMFNIGIIAMGRTGDDLCPLLLSNLRIPIQYLSSCRIGHRLC